MMKFFLTFKPKQIISLVFGMICATLENNTSLPVSQCYVTQTKSSSINFNHEDILKIIRNLVQNKAHGQDGILIRIILCDKTLLEPLSLLLNKGICSNTFQKN